MSRRCGQAESPENYFFLSYEAALERAGVDYERDGEQLLTEYIIPALEEIKEDYLAKDEAALNIYREAGLDEIKVRWRSFDTARLSLLQKRKIHKIAKDLELLGDAQMHFIIMGTVIYRHRPDLKEKYDTDTDGSAGNCRAVSVCFCIDKGIKALYAIYNIYGWRINNASFFGGECIIIATNGFVKKQQKTPKSEIDLAKRRRKIHMARKIKEARR